MKTRSLVYEMSEDYKAVYIKLLPKSNRLDESTDTTNIAHLRTSI